MNQDPKPQLGQAGLKACMVYWHAIEMKRQFEMCLADAEKDELIWNGLTLEAKEAISYGYS